MKEVSLNGGSYRGAAPHDNWSNEFQSISMRLFRDEVMLHEMIKGRLFSRKIS